MFHQQLAMIDRVCERDHAGHEHVVRRQLMRFHDVEPAHDIRHEAADLLEIPDVIAGQHRVQVRQLGRAHRDVTIVELFCVEEFARRRRRQFEPFRRLDLVEFLEDAVALRPLWLPENVKAPEPRREGDTARGAAHDVGD